MQVIYAPQKVDFSSKAKRLRVFLAGSIEMGIAELWQDKIVKEFADVDVDFLNPRRLKWDSTIEQKIDDLEFKEQVNWELDGLEKSDIILFYFDPNTKSPITLLELGLFARSGKCIVYCPKEFWRKGNVDIVAERCNVPVFYSLKDFVDAAKMSLRAITSN